LSVFGAIYSWVFIRETRGLSDREKKLLFVPKEFLVEFESYTPNVETTEEL
jgi:hypothetical protein